MSVRLMRESSETPNITNRDDTRMIRFAYGDLNGVIKDFDNELSYSTSVGKFTLNSGRIVLQGWEVDVDGAGWELDLSTVIGTQYHLVYLEINVAVETAVIKSTYLTGSVPTIDLGNDLTKYPEGIARLPLYSFRISNGVISDVTKLFSLLTYYGPKIAEIESRLTKLGFREGSVDSIPFNTSEIKTNYLKRQGNYVIGGYSVSFSDAIMFENLSLPSLGIIPEEFRPNINLSNIQASVLGIVYITIYNPNGSSYQAQITGYYTGYAAISKDTGNISWNIPPQINSSADFTVSQLQELIIQFGYEAKPIE